MYKKGKRKNSETHFSRFSFPLGTLKSWSKKVFSRENFRKIE
jgi:hypothetical protein